MGKPKAITVEIVQPDSTPGQWIYPTMNRIVKKFHAHLIEAKICAAWNMSWKADVDGRLVLGKCKKGSDLDRELHGWDFVILLNMDAWKELSSEQRTALLDHELCHAQVALDPMGKPKKDVKGRIVYRTRKHDLEEFREIVSRHGLYKSDIEAFAQVCFEKANAPLLETKESKTA